MRLLSIILLSLFLFTACEKDVEDVKVKKEDTTNVERESIHERDMKEHADSTEKDTTKKAEEKIRFGD